MDNVADPLVTARSRIGTEWRNGESRMEIRDPYRGTIVGTMPVSSQSDCEEALAAASAAKRKMADMPGYERAALLRRIADEVDSRLPEIARVLTRESGKPLSDARTEVQRSTQTLRLSAEEAVRITGEHIPMDGSAIGAGKIGMLLRFPVGVVAAITPFNAPINLTAHKLGPALAAGNTIVIKPSPKAPLAFALFIEAVIAAGVPDGAVNTIFGDAVGPQLVSDPRVDFISFTGSIPVGKSIRAAAGMKRLALELGGVGPTFVSHDADLDVAARACARNAMYGSGQSCISVQNVYVERSRFDDFTQRLQHEVAGIRFGDPLDPKTDVGTLIDEAAAIRVAGTVERAAAAGAKVLCGGTRRGAQVDATIAIDVDKTMDLVAQEIFGPAVTVQPYDHIEPLFEEISLSPFGLQCGIFTNSLHLAQLAFRSVRTGAVIVNGTSRWRSDQMPYGGVKDSGLGREGPRSAIRDMTEERVLILA